MERSEAAGLSQTAVAIRKALRRPHVVCALSIVLAIVLAAVAAPLLAPADPMRANVRERLRPPAFLGGEGSHLLGTDQLGRDMFSRVLFGARVSLVVATGSVIGAALVGVLLGLVAGYIGGIPGVIIMRLADIQLAFPFVLLALAIVAALGPGIGNLIAVFVITGWVVFTRLVRGQVVQVRERDYVESARGLGAGHWNILRRHVLPNVTGPLVVLGSFEFAKVVIWEASLSFLGLGVPAALPSWGSMLSDGRQYVDTAWWVATFPGLALMTLVLAINSLGDALRDALDPRRQPL